MQPCVQTSSSSENFSVAGTSTEMSVLERQRAVFQRMYHDQHHQQFFSQDANAMSLYQYQNLMNSMNIHQSLDENSPNFGRFACSEITSNTTSLDIDQHQRSFSTVSATNSYRDHQPVASTKKRKAELDAEDKCKEKRFEEAGEVQSELTVKSEKENSGKTSKENSKASEAVQKNDYIHVRARRGQATDSHSLAERARREKISKKMKCLQDLVPGCNKVTGKAGMLDEIINYVHSLKKQVEFLSMKLAALNKRMDINTEHFFAKEFPPYIASCSTAATPLELMQSTYHQYNQGSHPQGSNCSVDTSTNPTTQMVPQKSGPSSLSFPEAYLDSISSLQGMEKLAIIGLGALVSDARFITDGMLLAAAECLASYLTDDEIQNGILYPSINSIRDITAEVGAAVLRAAVAEELAEGHHDVGPKELVAMSKEENVQYVKSNM